MVPYRIYIVDDEETIRLGLTESLKGSYQTRAFPDAEEALEAMKEETPDLVLLDLGLPGMGGLEALAEIRRRRSDVQVIVVTAYEDVATIVTAMKAGAHDYVVKPLHMDTLEVSIRNALEAVRLRREVRLLQENALREHMPRFVGKSDTIQDVMELVATLARSPDTPVLVVGETGTGKELVASAIHFRSPNFDRPLVSVNCATIPKDLVESELFGYERGAFSGANAKGKKGLVEQAEGGTLFLDEVGDLGMEAQAKLLRFLEDGSFYRVGGTKPLSVRTRVVSATNKNLQDLISKGLFREDLYYRLAVVRIEVPSLNDRREDVVPMARHFLAEFNRKFDRALTGFDRDAEEALASRQWKGNVRELKNLVERAVLVGRGSTVALRDLGIVETPQGGTGAPSPEEARLLPPLEAGGVDLPAVEADVERHYFTEALRRTGGNESQAALLLNLNHHTFRYRRRKLGI